MAKLNKLAKLDKLNKLAKLDKLNKLAKLNKLNKLAKLDKLYNFFYFFNLTPKILLILAKKAPSGVALPFS